MGKLRFDCYEDFANRIEFPVIAFRAETGEVVIMNYEAKLILGQKTKVVKVEQERAIENGRFWSQLHDRKALSEKQLILTNETRTFRVAGLINEFDVDNQLYYLLIFDQRTSSSGDQELLEQSIENSNVVVVHVGFQDGEELKVNYISKNINRFGFTCEEFYNGKLKFKDIIHPDDLDIVLNSFAENANGQNNNDNLNYRIVTESRKVCFVRCNVHFTRNQYGSIEGMELIMIDVTEEELEKTENQYLRSAIEQSNSVVLVARFKQGVGTVKYASTNALGLGMDVEDLRKGRKLFSGYVVPEDRQKVLDILHKSENVSVTNYTAECRILGEDGVIRWIQFCTTIKDLDSETYDAELILNDITEDKLYEQSMLQSQKELEEKLKYVTSSHIETSEWKFQDFLAKEDVELFLKTYSELNQVYTAGINEEGKFLTLPAGPMVRLGEFYEILEKPEYRERIKEAIARSRNEKYVIIDLEQGNPERQLGIVPIILEDRIISAALIGGLDSESVERMNNSIESLQRLTEMLVSAQFKNRYLEMDSVKSRMAEESMREELEGQVILSRAFANMRYDTNATVQEIIEKSCDLLHASSIAIYYGDPEQETYSCIAKHAINEQKKWEFPDQSWRMAEICRKSEEVSAGRYIVYNGENYSPECETIRNVLDASSFIICGIRVHHVVCGGLLIAVDDRKQFSENEASYCIDVAHTIQGIFYRKLNQSDANLINRDLLNAYNYVKECVFIKDIQDGKVLFANEAMETLFGIDVTGMDSRAFLADPTPTYTREGIQPVRDIKWQSYIRRINKIMNIQELTIEWKNGKEAKLVIMRENTSTPDYYNQG